MTLTLLHFELLGAALFCLGLYGALARRSAVLVLMSIELMLNGVNVIVVAFAAYSVRDNVAGLVIAIFVITIAAAEVALAMAIILRLFRSRGSVNVDEMDALRG